MRIKKYAVVAVTVILFFTFADAQSIEGKGASFPNPIYKAWSADYFKATRKRVGYVATDSGDGITSIVHKRVDFGASDKPLTPKELSSDNLFSFPTVIGAIAIVYHLDGVKDGALKLSREALYAIFSGKVTFWDDPLITKENPSLPLPHTPMNVIVRSDASGTTYNFTDFLHHINSKFPVREQPKWEIKNRIEVSSNSEVWAELHERKNSIGYIEYAYKKRLHMHAAKVENRAGKFVPATVSSIQEALKNARWTEENYYYTTIVDSKGNTSYPLASATFLFISQEQNENNKAVISFLDWVYLYGDQKAIMIGYVPLPFGIKKKIRAFWKRRHLDR